MLNFAAEITVGIIVLPDISTQRVLTTFFESVHYIILNYGRIRGGASAILRTEAEIIPFEPDPVNTGVEKAKIDETNPS